MSTVSGLSSTTLAPLSEYIASLSSLGGGRHAEATVTFLDTQAKNGAKKALGALNAALAGGAVAGGVAGAARAGARAVLGKLQFRR